MTNQPNIKKEIVEYVLENTNDTFDTVNLRQFAKETGYEEHRVANKAFELGVFNWGINCMHPWYEDRQEVEEKLQKWD